MTDDNLILNPIDLAPFGEFIKSTGKTVDVISDD